jgi:hypothetical protein
MILPLALFLFSFFGGLPLAAQTAASDSTPSGAELLQLLRAKAQALFGPSCKFLTQRVSNCRPIGRTQYSVNQ